MDKLKLLIPEVFSFLIFYAVYGFCVGMLVYLALTPGTVGLGRAESIRYCLYAGLIISPIVYLGVQIVEHRDNKKKSLQEKLREEIRKYLENRT